jgi:hypothetical protein
MPFGRRLTPSTSPNYTSGDLELPNHSTLIRPGTRFTTLRVANIPLAAGFASMVDGDLKVYGLDGVERRRIAGEADYARTLREVFCDKRGRGGAPVSRPSGGGDARRVVDHLRKHAMSRFVGVPLRQR